SQVYAAAGANLADLQKLADLNLIELGTALSAPLERRQAMLRFLMNESEPVELTWLYAESGGSRSDIDALAGRGLIALGEDETWRDPLDSIRTSVSEALHLTPDQQKVWLEVQGALKNATHGRAPNPLLLHGVTGSGKTEIYLRAVAETLRLGRQALVLVPEIALTPQTVRRFLSRFPNRVGLIHSGLSIGERYDTWRRARAGELDVIVGPRSALFTPLSNIGLIVVDESHDDSYYQSESPYYHARSAAVMYAEITNAVCLLGSATPDITSAYRAARREWHYLRLPARILAHQQAIAAQLERLGDAIERPPNRAEEAVAFDLPPVQIVDMRAELKGGNRSIFSHALQKELQRVLEAGQQAILFLNRRGTATYVFCRDCGFSLKCPQCDLPLTYHIDRRSDTLDCHHCGYRRKLPQTCPECGGARIRHYGMGTERVEAELQTVFPGARLLRWDASTTRTKGAHEQILKRFAAREADILVGTQMLAKGLDLPFVTLVGVVLADVGLNMPDYRANERAFQVLTQVAGRAGRSMLGGQVIFQTFQPDHYVIQAAARHDYRRFYERELAYRQQLGYPPFTHMVRIESRDRDERQAEQRLRQLAAEIRVWLAREDRRATQLVGPAPCFFARLAGQYRWQLIVKGPDPVSLLRNRRLDEFRVEVNPVSLL
ncbi:MAG TPA: primosomal protein N', partial [Anaerolineales bacterium]|nr:primosomal protein N' [Anaerolineales bacterium]